MPLRSVSIALDVLEAFRNEAELSVTEIARRADIAKSTASRTCGVLAERGILERTTHGRYRLGARLMEYGNLAKLRHGLSTKARLLLTEIRDLTGETAQLGVAAGVDVLYVERVEAVRSLRHSSESYRYSALHRSSIGKVLAAHDERLAEARIEAGLPPSTGYTIVMPDTYREVLVAARINGYAESVEESELGGASLAVPVRTAGGEVVAGLGVAGPTRRIVEAKARHLEALRRGASALASAIDEGEISLPRASR